MSVGFALGMGSGSNGPRDLKINLRPQMVCLVYPHPPSFLRPPTALPASRPSISLLETEVTSPHLSQRFAAGSCPLAFPPSIHQPSTSPDLLRPAPSRCWFCARLNSSLPLQPLQHPPSPRTTLPSSPRLRSTVGLFLLLRRLSRLTDCCACRRPKP